jgi:short subunit dehydrogenase-like uncharacterized protein
MTPRDANRPFDIVIFGATGFAGRLTAEYLVRHAPADCRLALAGRNTAKLAELRTDLTQLDPAFADTALLTADVSDEGSLREMARQARVVITTVGPYVLYGDAVVAACAASGTDYLDLTGEPEFVDTSYVRHHRTALDTGARLVHAAGFDSIPHDLGALFTVEQLPNDQPLSVSGYLRASGAFSGGTFHSAVTALSRPRQNIVAARERRRSEPQVTGRSARAVTGRPHRDPVNGGWAVPLPTVDPQVVARSGRALERYGPDFRYSHFATLPRLTTVAGGALGLGAVFGMAQIPPARRFLLSRVQPGDGPSPQKRAKSWFEVTFVGTAADGERVVTRVSGGDPGYDETAKMLAESALSLAFDDLPPTAGQVTTAAAMGDALLDRLRKADIAFDILG